MSDPYLVNSDMDLHFRDARHAKQLFSAHGHAFTPKTKFLYHVAFQPTSEVAAVQLSNSSKFQKEIGVLAKSAELPRFRATIDTKQQYNRKKHVQTRIDYEDITIRLHDDNLGVTRSLLEEYYRYYVKDGDHPANSYAFGPRDKYANVLAQPNYGLNAGRLGPFFEYIKIYQLSRQEWFSYTLVNPLLSSWQHDGVDSADGSGTMENTISVAYEAVIYDHGSIAEGSEPVGFASEETRYDFTPSPLQRSEAFIPTSGPELNETTSVYSEVETVRASNQSDPQPTDYSDSPGFLGSVLTETAVPSVQTNTAADEISRAAARGAETFASDLQSNPRAKQSFMAQALNSGEVSGSYQDYATSTPDERAAMEQQAYDQIQGSVKMQSFAYNSLTDS